MQGSKYAPTKVEEFSSKDLNANLQGYKFTTTPWIDGDPIFTVSNYKVDQDHILQGAEISIIGTPHEDDYFIGQVVDVDNILGAGAGYVAGTYVPRWEIVPGIAKQLNYESNYPAKLIHGLYLRITYVSINPNSIKVKVNYKLHKVLW